MAQVIMLHGLDKLCRSGTCTACKDEYEQTGVEINKPPRTLEEMYKRAAWGNKFGHGF